MFPYITKIMTILPMNIEGFSFFNRILLLPINQKNTSFQYITKFFAIMRIKTILVLSAWSSSRIGSISFFCAFGTIQWIQYSSCSSMKWSCLLKTTFVCLLSLKNEARSVPNASKISSSVETEGDVRLRSTCDKNLLLIHCVKPVLLRSDHFGCAKP